MNGVSIIEAEEIVRITNQLTSIHEMFMSTVKRLEKAESVWMTLEETCTYMRKGTTWLYANKSKIGFAKIGGEIMFRRKRVDEYMESRYFQSK